MIRNVIGKCYDQMILVSVMVRDDSGKCYSHGRYWLVLRSERILISVLIRVSDIFIDDIVSVTIIEDIGKFYDQG